MSKKVIIVQQYLSWKGHYRQYFENLFDSKYFYLYASNREEQYKSAWWIKSNFDAEKPLDIKTKILGRFVDSFNVFKYLGSVRFDIIHLIEFEPLTFLLLAGRFKKQSKLIITIHSSDKLHFSNWFSSKLSAIQRNLLNRALREATRHGATIVTHYECHKESVLKIIGDQFEEKVHVIEYPAPKPKYNHIKVLTPGNSSPTYLIYGQIREDKGIYEFLQNESTAKLRITIAGKIVDRRILEFQNRKNLTIIDKFLSEDEISGLIETHDFMLLPYPIEYTNGAGTFKDSLSMGMPVVCSKIPIFEETVNKHRVGVTFSNPGEICEIAQTISESCYEELSKNCLRYANRYNWEYMRESYFRLYEQYLNTQVRF